MGNLILVYIPEMGEPITAAICQDLRELQTTIKVASGEVSYVVAESVDALFEHIDKIREMVYGHTPAQTPAENKYLYEGKAVTVIQLIAKTNRAEVMWSESHKEGEAGFWVNASELSRH
jgi:hypothetical protein